MQKFRDAHSKYFQIALSEIKSGKKKSHWMWFIFPQISGLGHSETAKFYSIKNLHEAKEFLHDEILGKNLIEISEALLTLKSNYASAIFGYPDDLKLKSSMTLFSLVPNAPEVFQKVLSKFFDGENDPQTVKLLAH